MHCVWYRWKTGKELQSTIVHVPTNNPTSEAVVKAFIAARCALDDEYEWLDLDTRIGSMGTEELGFKPALVSWARTNGVPVPRLQLGSAIWTKKVLPANVKVKLGMTAKQLQGLEYVDASAVDMYAGHSLLQAPPQTHAPTRILRCVWPLLPSAPPVLE